MTRNLSFVFPGQGSQFVGMADDLIGAHQIVRHTFEEASDALRLDLIRLCREGPEATLNQTENTQPALLTVGVALWRLWCRETDSRPVVMAGHSLGEFSALVAGGALELTSAAMLVAERGRQMQRAVPKGEGAMAAIIGLDDEAVQSVCETASGDEIVTPANYNAPGQVVISGHARAVARAIETAKAKGAKRAMELPVSVPSHCALMQPAADALAPKLDSIPLQAPETPVLHNVDVAEHREPEAIRQALIQQLYCPVRWTETVACMKGRGVTKVLECGPGRVLSGLTRRIDRKLETFSIGSRDAFDKACHSLSE